MTYRTKISGVTIDTGITTTLDFLLDPLPGSISGKITDSSTGLPIVGASVEVRKGLTVIATQLTDPNGNYGFDNLPPGQYTVTASATNYQTKTVGATVVSSTTATENIALDPNPGTLTGRVTDSGSTNPISGALVRVFKGSTVVGSALTDSNGYYTIQNLPTGGYAVGVTATDYQAKIVGATIISNSTTTVDVALDPSPGSISGQITDALTSNPIPSAQVSVYQGQVLVNSVIADANGFYSIDNLAPGQYTVTASATNYQTKSVGASVSSGVGTTVFLELDPDPGAIQGQVTDAITGLPIAGAEIQVFSGNVLIDSALTDSNGNYTLSGFAPGSYTVTAKASNYQSSTLGALVSANSTTTVNFQLTPLPGAITGTVIDFNTTNPIQGAIVLAFDGTTIVGFAVTDANGAYTMPGLAEGSYILLAFALDYQIGIGAAIVTPNSTSVVNFALLPDPGEISGTVTDFSTTDPIPGATIEIYSGTTLIGSALTDSSGNYTVPGLPPGNYLVKASATGYQTQTVSTTVTANTTTTVDFALIADPGSIAGTVTNAYTGAPIAGATVAVFDNTTFIASAVTDANGQYNIPGLAPGQYIVVGSATNFSVDFVGAVVVSDTTTTANLALTPDPGAISGTVTDQSSSPIPNTLIEIRKGPLLIGTTLTDSNGNYNFPGLYPDTYTVVAKATNYQSAVQTAVVSSDMVTEVNFVLQLTPGTLTGTVTSSGGGNPPIPNATVLVYQGSQLISTAVTDATGGYTVSNLAPGSYNVVVNASGFQSAFSVANITAGATTVENFQLDPDPGSIQGTVLEECSLGPVSGALVIVSDGSIIYGFDVTDNSGSYTVPDLAPGTYTVTVLRNTFLVGSQQATVSSDAVTTVNFTLTPQALPPASISGKALYNYYLTQKDRVHIVRWTPSRGLCTTGYQLYRNGVLIAEFSADANLEYIDHCRNGKTDTYEVRTVNAFGGVSDPIAITLH